MHQIRGIEYVYPPKIDNEIAAMILLVNTLSGYYILMDMSPNTKCQDELDEEKWVLGKQIAKLYQAKLVEILIKYGSTKNLKKIGLWNVPILLPFPLSKISVLVEEDRTNEAIELLCNHCNYNFLEKLIAGWWSIDLFNIRKELIQNSFDAFKTMKYDICIHALTAIPEGIITDHLASTTSSLPSSISARRGSIKDLHFDEHILVSEKLIIDESSNFILKGPFYENFDWSSPLNQDFVNRHALLHGKDGKVQYTKENAIRLYLLLDTLYYILEKAM